MVLQLLAEGVLRVLQFINKGFTRVLQMLHKDVTKGVAFDKTRFLQGCLNC